MMTIYAVNLCYIHRVSKNCASVISWIR